MSLRSAYCKIRKYATSIAEIKLQRLRCPQSDWSGQKAVAGLSSHQHSVIWFWAQYRSAVKPCFCDSLRWETLPIEQHVRRAHASANVLVGQVTSSQALLRSRRDLLAIEK